MHAPSWAKILDRNLIIKLVNCCYGRILNIKSLYCCLSGDSLENRAGIEMVLAKLNLLSCCDVFVKVFITL